ncbi:hypothetical protein FA09DRAFT_324451 [Tilletiopsis washingtonensis]|uniref:Uncharacterized protein n=1 Tax=Tilletiopsis washingtonensis TaxID=58919 RepID=A0A316ZF81_9BASI|nr:hypothetical protein FA09DRAFT_324451 [Tilletiopsis washingtonensis]PWO00418.1 hypothetical protein FA09DRAFT_324451 [Tilletiopsis washingtonensis]
MPRSSSSRRAPPEAPARAPESAGSSSSSGSAARFVRQRKDREATLHAESSAEAETPDSDRRPARLLRQVADASALDAEPVRSPRRGAGPQRQAQDGVHALAGPFDGAAVKRRPPKADSRAAGDSAREGARLAVIRQRAPSPDGTAREVQRPSARHTEDHPQSKASHSKPSAVSHASKAATARPLRDHKKKHRHASAPSSSTSTCTTSTSGMHKTKAAHTASATARMASDDSNSGLPAKGTSFNAAPGWGDLPGATHADRSAGWELRPHTSEGLAITVCLLVLLGLVVISLWAFMMRRWKRQRAADRCSKVHLHSRHSSAAGRAVSGASLRKSSSRVSADGFLHAPKQALRRLASAARGGASSQSQQASFSRLGSPSLAHSPFRLCVPEDDHATTPSAPLGALGTVMRTAFGLIEQYPASVSHAASPSPAPSPSLAPLDCAYAGSPNMSKALAKGWGADGASPHGLTSAAGGACHGLLPGRRPSTKRRSPFDLADSPILAPSAAFGSPRRGYTHTLAPGASFAALSPDVERKGMVYPNSPRRPSLLRFDSGGTTLVPSEWAGSHASLELDAGMVGLGIGMDHALDSKLAAPLVEHHSTQPCGEVLPSKAVMLVADIRAAHERSLSSSRLEEADASTSTKTLCAETLELGLLWQPLPGDGALRDGGPMELRVEAEGSAESSFEAGNLSSDAFPFGLSDDRPDLSVVGGITTSFGGLNEHAEAPLHDLVAISASSSERSFTVYETGTHLPSRVARALTEAGLTSADERNTSLDAARAVSSVSAHDESVVFVGIHDAELFPPSQAWLGRESLCAEPLDMLSMREELDFTPAYSATLQHMQDILAPLSRSSEDSERSLRRVSDGCAISCSLSTSATSRGSRGCPVSPSRALRRVV